MTEDAILAVFRAVEAAIRDQTEPFLGLATTRQLIEELIARRVRFGAGTGCFADALRRFLDQQPDQVLDYRTVDS